MSVHSVHSLGETGELVLKKRDGKGWGKAGQHILCVFMRSWKCLENAEKNRNPSCSFRLGPARKKGNGSCGTGEPGDSRLRRAGGMYAVCVQMIWRRRMRLYGLACPLQAVPPRPGCTGSDVPGAKKYTPQRTLAPERSCAGSHLPLRGMCISPEAFVSWGTQFPVDTKTALWGEGDLPPKGPFPADKSLTGVPARFRR